MLIRLKIIAFAESGLNPPKVTKNMGKWSDNLNTISMTFLVMNQSISPFFPHVNETCNVVMFAFTFRARRRHFYPKQLTISTFVRRRRNK